jgi:cell division protein FtsI/penicillin-binding protein 2
MSRKRRIIDQETADRSYLRRTVFVGVCCVCVLSLLSWRLIHVQYIEHDKYSRIVAREHVRRAVLYAQRGRVYDCRGELLAGNRVSEKVCVDRDLIANVGLCARGLAFIEGVKARDIIKSFSKEEIQQRYLERLAHVVSEPLGKQPWEVIREITQAPPRKVEIVLAKNLDQSDSGRLKELLDEERISGVYFRESRKRFYPTPNRLSQVLGIISHEGEGVEGIEGSMNDVLRGEDGYRYYERDRKGREIAAFRGEFVEPKNGRHVRLTIDSTIQNIVEEVLDENGPDRESIYVPQLNAEKVSVVMLEAKTGAVMAMVNRPHFDLETRRGSRLNACVSSVYDPGSTFKIVTLGSAFHHGLVKPTTTITLSPNGILKGDGFTVRDDHVYLFLTAEGILVKSSNIGAFRIASQLGETRFYEAMRAFGFGQKTGIRLGAEAAGFVRHPRTWTKPDMSRMAMGYSVAVTPLQMVAGLSVIVNDGVLYPPHILEAVFDDRGLNVEVNRPKPAGQVISERAAHQVRRALVKVCQPGGTGTQAAIPGYTMGGKTGTAEKFDAKSGAYLKGRYVVSFMGFVPADNPKFIAIVVVDDPKVDYVKRYGGTIAAPLFKRIAERSLEYFNVEATPELAEAQNSNLTTPTDRPY